MLHPHLQYGMVNKTKDSLDEENPGQLIRKDGRHGTRRPVQEIRRLRAISKIYESEPLTTQDTIDLISHLEHDENRCLDFQEVAYFLKNVLEPPFTDIQVETLHKFCDVSEDGKITITELNAAVSSSTFRSCMHDRRVEFKTRANLEERSKIVVTGKDLLDRLTWRVNRDDAFRTFPFSLAFMMTFMAVVDTHLQTFDRQQAARGISNWIEGYGFNYPGPYHGEHIGDDVQFWEWMNTSGLQSMLVYCNNGTRSAYECPIPAKSVLVGDVMLRKLDKARKQEQTWLLNSPTARRTLQHRPGDLLYAARAGLQYEWQTNWRYQDSTWMAMVVITWSNSASMFTLTSARVTFDDWGFVIPQCLARTAIIRPYKNKLIFGLDALYLILLLMPTVAEARAIAKLIASLGFVPGLYSYADFWNMVDWFGILLGWSNVTLWIMLVQSAHQSNIQDLLDGNYHLKPGAMDLSINAIDGLEKSLEINLDLVFNLQIFMGINMLSIMMKFFKAFQSNPRLQLVTSTLIKGASELFHFSIVFLAIFLGFAVSGFILFGNDIVNFSSFQRSILTAWLVLLGDFGWYSDTVVTDRVLASGLPKVVLDVWFIFYTMLVLLVLLNMLLAIVMDHYIDLVAKVRNAKDAPPIWKQARRYASRLLSSRGKGFIPLEDLLAKLSERKEVQPEEVVTEDTLIEMVQMKDEQAHTLFEDLLIPYAAEKKKSRQRAREQQDSEGDA